MTTQIRRKKVIAWAALLLFGLLWGATLPMSKIAVSTGHQSFALIFWQMIIAILALGGILLRRGWKPRFSVQLAVFYLMIAILGTIIPNGFSYLAAAQLPAGVMSIAIATVPMFSLAIALGFRIERFSVIRFAGILIGFAAMMLIVAPETSLPEPEKAVYVLIALLAPLCYGLEANYIATNTPSETDAVSTLFMASCYGLPVVAFLCIATGQWINPLEPWSAPEYALAASSLIHAITYVGYIWLIAYGGPVFSVQIAYPVTLSGVFLSILFLGESYSGWIWSALVLVIVALFLVQPHLGQDSQPQETS